MGHTINIALVEHRPNMLAGYDLDIPFYRHLQNELVQYIKQASLDNDIVCCHTGMSLGADTIWALAVLEAKQDTTIYADIQLIAHIPYGSQPDTWFDVNDKKRWAHIKEHADETIVHTDITCYPRNQQKQYAIKAIQETVHVLIENCDILLAVYNGDTNSDIAHIIQNTLTYKPVFQIRIDRPDDTNG